jgi:hypothetical protein
LASSAEWFNAQDKLKQELERALETEERNKTAEEKEIVALVDRTTDELLVKHGLPPLHISPEHVHILAASAYNKLFPESRPGSGSYNQTRLLKKSK